MSADAEPVSKVTGSAVRTLMSAGMTGWMMCAVGRITRNASTHSGRMSVSASQGTRNRTNHPLHRVSISTNVSAIRVMHMLNAGTMRALTVVTV